MAVKTIITCDWCGISNERLKNNGWLCMAGDADSEILIRRAITKPSHPSLEWKDYCGEACIHKALSGLLGGSHE